MPLITFSYLTTYVHKFLWGETMCAQQGLGREEKMFWGRQIRCQTDIKLLLPCSLFLCCIRNVHARTPHQGGTIFSFLLTKDFSSTGSSYNVKPPTNHSQMCAMTFKKWVRVLLIVNIFLFTTTTCTKGLRKAETLLKINLPT